jgi:hypothetical protein
VVPAVAPDGIDDVLLVPDREWERWVPSHPLGYGAHLSDVNSEHETKVVPLVKLMKYWRDVHMVNRRPKSYWLEGSWSGTSAAVGWRRLVADVERLASWRRRRRRPVPKQGVKA